MGTDIQLLGDFDRDSTEREQEAIAAQTHAVERLYDDIPYAVGRARITDDVEPPTRAKYHGRHNDTVQISLRSMEMDDVQGVWAHELGHDLARQTFYDEVRDEPRLYRTTADETFAYLVQYEVMDTPKDPAAIGENYFDGDEEAWGPLRSAMDPEVLGSRAEDIETVEDEIREGYSEELLEAVEGLKAGGADVNMFVSDLPISEYLDGAGQLQETIGVLEEAVDDGSLDRDRLGERLWEEAQNGQSEIQYEVEQRLQEGADERTDLGEGGFVTAAEFTEAMEDHAYDDGLGVINALTKDALERMEVGIDEQQKVADTPTPAHWVREAVRDEKYGYGSGSRMGYDQYIDFPHGAGRIMAAVMYDEGVSSRDIVDTPDRVMRAGRDMMTNIIEDALEGGDPSEDVEEYAREGLTVHRVIGQ